ncbi:hypothetical protein MU0083_003251 [[Mycobacterium] kokjensenii]|uniref:DUF4386 family protein n=1 Tax=[Mycobacterium] kokjensenii TaxID=3064287 RepID=A0ABM9LRX6_9MYCO|nr:hypothetical protein [Mycolicibacter sp. MU0083]CAJ1503702.1 hypothetical protein MU0083_003251 [Mycolicibacter sp. MU0083]
MQLLAEVEDSSQATAFRAQLVLLWSGPAIGAVLLAMFLAFPGFFPPMSPTMSADQVAQFYDEHRSWIRLSMVGFNLCGIMIVPFLLLVVAQMKRMTGQSHVFAYAYLACMVSGATLFALSNIYFGVAAFRPSRSPEVIQALNDMAWLSFIAPVGMIVGQFAMLACAVYFDRGPDPVFPRWVAHLSVATALAMLPSVAATVFTTGPLAWDGFISFWVRNGAFAIFVFAMFFALRDALYRQGVAEGLIEESAR